MRSILGFVIGFVGAFWVVQRAAPRGLELVREWLLEPQQEGGPRGPMLADERIATWIRSEWNRLGLAAPTVDATAVDGIVYLRGRESDPVRLDTMIAVARSAPGAQDVVDEVKRGPTDS